MQWAVTVAFYCAVHCLEAHLADHGEHGKTHQARMQKLITGETAVPDNVYAAYRRLKQWSEDARYRLGRFDDRVVRTQVVDRNLKVITDFANL
jgi:hypothetical protein